MTPGNASLSGDRPGEGVPALVWMFASEPGRHRAAAAKLPVPLATSQTALWTGDSCVGEKRICKRPALGNSR
jgi:hypothetical protein